jgi:hypothetical protein
MKNLRIENMPETLLAQEREDGVRRAKPLFFVERYARSYRVEWSQACAS